MKKIGLTLAVFSAVFGVSSLHATIELIAKGSLSGSASDLSGQTGTLESGVAANLLGGLSSGLAWAGGNTFIALPDRGPNALAYTGGAGVDNTTSYISRFNTITLDLTEVASGGLPFTLTPTLQSTTLLYSPTALNYGTAPVPAGNSANVNYFTGRSDAFAAGSSTNPANARLDPEGVRVSNDGSKVYISDEYGPYVYEFNRATGERTNTYTLPANVAVSNLSSNGATEISGNTSGRVANKGMEGLAITPDGKTLYGFVQSPLIQDGGDGGRSNRVVTVDLTNGTTHEYAYDNRVGAKNYNSSEILALNDHEFLVLERDGKGLGDGTNAVFKGIYKVDFSGATDVTAISGETALQAVAPTKTLFLDLKAALNAKGFADNQIPAKLEGMAFGADYVTGGTTYHTLYVGNDNDFTAAAGDNQIFVFSFTDADLNGSSFLNQALVSAVPEPSTYAAILGGVVLAGAVIRRRRRAAR